MQAAKLPEHLKVTTKWTLDANWSLCAKLIAPSTSQKGKSHALQLLDLFEGEEAAKEWLKLPWKANANSKEPQENEEEQQEEEDGASNDADSSDDEQGPVTPKKKARPSPAPTPPSRAVAKPGAKAASSPPPKTTVNADALKKLLAGLKKKQNEVGLGSDARQVQSHSGWRCHLCEQFPRLRHCGKLADLWKLWACFN